MEPLVAVLAGIMTACALYLLMTRNLVRVVLGTALLAHGINLAVLVSGRLTRTVPPLVGGGETAPAQVANALPQALVLTAIVISFGLFMAVMVLAVQVRRTLGTVDSDRFRAAEPPPDVDAEDDRSAARGEARRRRAAE